jgi:putative endopeptidase
VNDELYTRLRGISESAAKQPAAPGSDPRKIGDFWATAMDVAKADRLGLAPLRAELAGIDAISSPAGVLDTTFAFKPIGAGALFRIAIAQDDKDSATMAVQIHQGGLGLPNRDFYFNPEAGVAKIRTAYVEHMARTFVLLGRDPAAARAAATQGSLSSSW